MSYLRRNDWIALGAGMVGVFFLLPALLAIRDVGVSLEAFPYMLQKIVDKNFIIIASIVYLVYVPVTVIMLRNVPFRPVLKYSFCVLFVPVFGILMVFNIAWSQEHLAWLSNWARQHEGGGRGAAMAVFIVTAPLAAIGSFVWYVLFAALDRFLAARDSAIEDNRPNSVL